MIGSELAAVAVADAGRRSKRSSICPATGRLVLDFRHWRRRPVEVHFTLPALRRRPVLVLPLFAKDGAIVPMVGRGLRVFGDASNSFDWYDDDGVSTAYQRGDYDHVAVTSRRRHACTDGASAATSPITSLVWTRARTSGRGSHQRGIGCAFDHGRARTITVATAAFSRIEGEPILRATRYVVPEARNR